MNLNLQLPFDPGAGEAFWRAVSQLPGFPQHETIPLKTMLFESNALFKLPQLVHAFDPQRILVVMDETPMQRAGQDLKTQIMGVLGQSSRPVETLHLQADDTGGVHTDMRQIGLVQARLRPGDLVLGLGSGCIADISKHACYLYEQAGSPHLPLMLYQTANSVSAFTSNMAPTFVDGVKRTLASRYPDALICDLETLRDAPYAMTAAGVGDLLAMFVSLPDWYLAHRLGMDDSYSPLAEQLMGPLDQIFLVVAQAIRERSLAGMAVLAKLIALGGLAMSLSHATTPMSGYEHVISHVLDLLAELAHRPLAYHGAQVAVATLLGAASYESFLQHFDPSQIDLNRCYPPMGDMQQRVESTFLSKDPSGKAGSECWHDYEQKLHAWHAHRPEFETFLRDWSILKPELAKRSRTVADITHIMRAVDLPLRFEALTPPTSLADAEFAYWSAPLMRKRLTLGDVLLYIGWDRAAIWQRFAS